MPPTRLLDHYYTTVVTLLEYLCRATKRHADAFTREEDGESFKALLQSTLIAIDCPLADIPLLEVHQPVISQTDIIDRVQQRLLATADSRSNNVLTIGYRSGEQRAETGKPGRTTVFNFFVNTVVDALRSHDWSVLLQRIGEEAMLSLLNSTSIFLQLPNGCLCQATGEPICELQPMLVLSTSPSHVVPKLVKPSSNFKRKQSPVVVGDTRPFKKRRVDPPQENQSSISSIRIVRSRMFYGRPSKVPKTGYIRIGLPYHHPLQQLVREMSLPRQQCEPVHAKDDVKREDDAARAILREMFPRQYGLPSIFNSQRHGSEDKHISRETPRRLKAVIPLVKPLLKRHSTCSYFSLLERICPSKLKRNAIALDDNIILEMVSETPLLQSQVPVGDITDPPTNLENPAINYAGKTTKPKPRFAEFLCSYQEVVSYVTSVTSTVVPKSLWGSTTNYRRILEMVSRFITCRRYETITLHEIVQGFSTNDCDWLECRKQQSMAQRICYSDFLKRRELVEEFLYWYFNSFLVPLLKNTFYCTESSAYRNKVLYFRQDDWQTLCQPLIERLISVTFEKLPSFNAHSVIKTRRLGFSFVRLLPKDTGVRPIVNLRRKPPKKFESNEPGQSINQVLQAAFQILTYERAAQPDLLGASVFGHNEIYPQLKSFKRRIVSKDGSLPPLYFVKVDVQACFDTIDQQKLLEILRHIIRDDGYMIRRYSRVVPIAGKLKKGYLRKACPDYEHQDFVSLATSLAASLRSAVFTDQVVYPFEYREDILALLEEHVTQNIVKIGSDFYRQCVGIPQGSVLSTILCSFFYGDLERTSKTTFRNDPSGLLLRYIDDFLFATCDLALAKEFLAVMKKGHPEYGCFISKEKTLTNFDCEDNLLNPIIPSESEFPWCGLRINMATLDVTVDYARQTGTHVADSLTVDRGRRSGCVFRYRVFQMVKHRSHVLFTDSSFNSLFTVRLNVYQNFLFAAMKTTNYIKSWGLDVKGRQVFAFRVIREAVSFAYANIRNKSIGELAKQNGAECGLRRVDVVWLGLQAFSRIFRSKIDLKSLADAIDLAMHKRQLRRLHRLHAEVTKRGMYGLEGISY